MNVLFPNGALVVIPQAVKAKDQPNGGTLFIDGDGEKLGALTVSGALVLPSDTEYTYEAPHNNPHVHDGH
jgi:hypothetical protein